MWTRRAIVITLHVCGTLLLTACPPEARDPGDTPSCPGGTRWDGARCVALDLGCPEGTVKEGARCVAAGPVIESDLSGAWAVLGTTPKGVSYSGSASVTAVDATRFRFHWVLTDATYRGVGIRSGNVISIGWSESSDHGAVSFAVASGTLDGDWWSEGMKAIGHETLTSTSTTFASAYTIAKGTDGSGSSYGGTCDVAQSGDLIVLMWRVGKETFRGLGIRRDSTLSVGFATGAGMFGVVQYVIETDGKTLSGRFASSGQKSTTLGTEVLTRTGNGAAPAPPAAPKTAPTAPLPPGATAI